MAFKFMENFYVYGNAGSELAAANTTFNTQWITHGTVPALITTGFKENAKALTLSRTASGTSQVERRIETSDDVVVIGYAFRSTARGDTTFQIKNNDDEVVINLEWPNQFQIGSEVGTATILLNKEYYVEIKLEKADKKVTLKVNGYPYLETTFTADATDVLQLFWGFQNAGDAADFVFSNVYFVDGSEGKYQDFIGPQRVSTRLNTEAVGEGWTPEPEGMTRLEIMQTIPPVPGQYTESDQVGDKDFYKSSDTVEDDAVITAVAITSLLTKTDIDDQYVALAISDGENDHLGADIAVPVQPAYFQQTFEQNATNADWDKASLEAVEYGAVIRPRPDVG